MNVDAFELLATAVLLVDTQGHVVYANTAAEDLFSRSRRQLTGQSAAALFDDREQLQSSIDQGIKGIFADARQLSSLRRGGESVSVVLTTVSLSGQPWPVLLEIREIEQRVLADRNHRLIDEIETHRELLRNLAHEVKNPLGGLRGAAQLLEGELPDPSLAEYTQVIISEADRLQALVDRLIGPQRVPLNARPVNIHEVCERVSALIQAEFREGVTILRDYDASMPDVPGDAARLMQAVLNVARNAAQELAIQAPGPDVPAPQITLRTRVARRVMLAHRQHRMALVLSIIDNGPGVPEQIRDRIFHPLVTARPGGTGLGLSLAQDFVQQHGGIIEFESRPRHTEFRLVLPMEPA
ncbi:MULTISPECIES: nitrogen regulation protein NR(II) [unclassified Achromobacter]|uniref:nitrogen regulation protein NR(II) n=1 Tax=unclassified Achromobacter TaxID=2626865 RepID=UPI000B51D0EE|nr:MULTISPECIES: nitrogen regulation protein NR(II) [unclassified Achromobacter]OWT80068.1 PAS domain-containing sensor histidine kinase [Achromobacter sp. HZ34]OWT81951.1 PAS domain-containing sensor histidine kinase [Achromobacter sp. HZ28]